MKRLKDHPSSNNIEPDSTRPVVKYLQLVTEEKIQIGQIVHIVDVQTAFVQHLEKFRGDRNYHWFPHVDAAANTIFQWAYQSTRY